MGLFFVSWQLWEEMTFVLGCAIIVVFLIGLFKLWQTSRQVQRQEVIDEEKRARLTEMRKVGLSPTTRKHRGNSDIPFGVRAIQTGVEVDGIWISRPTTPSRSSSRSNRGASVPEGAATKSRTAEAQAGAEGTSAANRPYTASALSRPPSQRDAQPTTSSAPLALDAQPNSSTPLPKISENAPYTSKTTSRTAPPAATSTSTPTAGPGGLNEEALRRLEGAYSPTGFANENTGANTTSMRGAPQLNTYIPSSRMSSPSQSIKYQNNNANATSTAAGQRMISTASADSMTSASIGGNGHGYTGLSGRSSRSNHSTSSRSSTSSRHQEPVDKLRQQYLPRPNKYDTAVPLPSPVVRLAPSGYYPATPRYSAPAVAPQAATAHAADAFANRATRKVNSAFEVLPAGTFGGRSGAAEQPQHTAPRNGGYTDNGAEKTRNGAGTAGPPVRNKLRRTSMAVHG